MKKTVVAILLILPFVLIYFVSITGRILAEYSHISVERVVLADASGNEYRENTMLRLNVGEVMDVNIHIYPELATNQEVTITPADTTVCTAGENNTLVAQGVGVSLVTLSSVEQSRIRFLFYVQVVDEDIREIEVSQTAVSVPLGEEVKIDVAILPSTVTLENSHLVWTSENNQVATVRDGRIVGVGVGTTIVRVSSLHKPDIYTDISVSVIEEKPKGIYFIYGDRLHQVHENNIALYDLLDIVDLPSVTSDQLTYTLKSFCESLDESKLAEGILSFAEGESAYPVVTIEVSYFDGESTYKDTLKLQYKPQS